MSITESYRVKVRTIWQSFASDYTHFFIGGTLPVILGVSR